MEIKYAYEMTRKAEEVRKEIQAKNNALARAFIEDHIMPEIERKAGRARPTRPEFPLYHRASNLSSKKL